MVLNSFKLNFRKEPLGLGEDLNVTPDEVMGKMFVEQVEPVRERQVSDIIKSDITEDIEPRTKSRFNNAANSGLTRIF